MRPGRAALQDDRVTRPDPLARTLRSGKERGLLQPRQDRATQLRVQLAQRDRTRDQIEQASPWPEAGQQASVDLGGLIEKEVGERARCDVAAVGAERERGEQQRREAKRLIGRRGRVHDSADPLWQAAGRRVTVLAAERDRHRPAHRPRRARTLLGWAVGEQSRDRPGRPQFAVRHLEVVPSTVMVTPSPSCAAVSARVTPSTSISMVASAGSARRSAGPVSASSRLTSRSAASSRSGSVTAVAKPSGGAPSAGNGNRSTGR